MTRATLEKLGGLGAFKDFVAEGVATGRKAHELGLRVGLGPIVDSPVGTMSLRQLLNKFARAALFGMSMNDPGEWLQYTALFSYCAATNIYVADPFLVDPPLPFHRNAHLFHPRRGR